MTNRRCELYKWIRRSLECQFCVFIWLTVAGHQGQIGPESLCFWKPGFLNCLGLTKRADCSSENDKVPIHHDSIVGFSSTFGGPTPYQTQYLGRYSLSVLLWVQVLLPIVFLGQEAALKVCEEDQITSLVLLAQWRWVFISQKLEVLVSRGLWD